MVSKPRIRTLKTRAEFLSLSKGGRRISPAPWLTLNYRCGNATQLECGWTIPKQVGTAVIRNRLKRWSREIIRHLWSEGRIQPCRVNLFFRPQGRDFFKKIKFEDFREVVESGLLRIRS